MALKNNKQKKVHNTHLARKTLQNLNSVKADANFAPSVMVGGVHRIDLLKRIWNIYQANNSTEAIEELAVPTKKSKPSRPSRNQGRLSETLNAI